MDERRHSANAHVESSTPVVFLLGFRFLRGRNMMFLFVSFRSLCASECACDLHGYDSGSKKCNVYASNVVRVRLMVFFFFFVVSRSSGDVCVSFFSFFFPPAAFSHPALFSSLSSILRPWRADDTGEQQRS